MPLIGLSQNLGGIIRRTAGAVVVSPSLAYDPPAGWTQSFTDDFVRPAQWGVNALDPAKWGQRDFGRGCGVHNGAACWQGGDNLQATGTTLRLHSRLISGTWYVDGFQQGYQNTNPGGYGYHPGYKQFHLRFRFRVSNYYAPGVGFYAAGWQANNVWGSEFDWIETPGVNKSRVTATMHWDSRGQYNLGTNNEYTSATYDTDLTQWITIDVRRTFKNVGGVDYATIEEWVNGVKISDSRPEWKDNRYMTYPLVMGFASYVAPNLDWAASWYSIPRPDTPPDTWVEIDYLTIWEPGSGTIQPVAKSLSLTPAAPGTLTEAMAGMGAPWATTVVAAGAVTNVTYQVRTAAGTVRGANSTLALTGGQGNISVQFFATGDYLRVWETGNPAVAVDSSPVTLATSAQTGRTLNYAPDNPGTRAANSDWNVTVTTTGITSITWVIVNSDYWWNGGGTQVATNGTVTINAKMWLTGQFLKVFDTNNPSTSKDSYQVTII